MNLVRKDNYLLPSSVVLGCLIIFYIWRAIDHSPHDFSNYYFAGKFFVEGTFDAYIYDPSTFNLMLAKSGYTNYFVNFAPNSPFIAVFFAPISKFDIHTAKVVFNIINGFFFLFSFVRVVKHLGITDKFSLLLIPFICFIPIRNGMLYGQFYLLLFSMIMEGYMLYSNRKVIPAMIFWVIPAALKMAPGVVLFYLIGKKDFRAIAIYLLLGGVVAFTTGLFLGFDIFTFYLKNISPKVSFGEIVSAGFLSNQSPLMFFKYLFVHDSVENPNPIFESNVMFILSMSLAYTCVLYFAFLTNSVDKSKMRIGSLAIWILLIFLISPYGSSYSRILLIIPFLAIIQSYSFKNQVVIGALLIVLTNFRYGYLDDWPILLRFPGFYATIVIFIIMVEFKYVSKKHILPVVILMGALGWYFYGVTISRKSSGGYLLNENPSLILNYELGHDMINYSFWKGEEFSGNVSLPFCSNDSSKVKITEGQLFLDGLMLTNSPDNKRKPILINNNQVVYLSDWGRGYGFYTLRTIRLN